MTVRDNTNKTRGVNVTQQCSGNLLQSHASKCDHRTTQHTALSSYAVSVDGLFVSLCSVLSRSHSY